MERRRKVRKSLRILGVHAEIRIGNLPCTSQKRNRLSYRVGLKKTNSVSGPRFRLGSAKYAVLFIRLRVGYSQELVRNL